MPRIIYLLIVKFGLFVTVGHGCNFNCRAWISFFAKLPKIHIISIEYVLSVVKLQVAVWSRRSKKSPTLENVQSTQRHSLPPTLGASWESTQTQNHA
jgi:hypothetical protein